LVYELKKPAIFGQRTRKTVHFWPSGGFADMAATWWWVHMSTHLPLSPFPPPSILLSPLTTSSHLRASSCPYSSGGAAMLSGLAAAPAPPLQGRRSGAHLSKASGPALDPCSTARERSWRQRCAGTGGVEASSRAPRLARRSSPYSSTPAPVPAPPGLQERGGAAWRSGRVKPAG
jgi:hypothetical protein